MSIRSQEPDPGKKTGVQRWGYHPIANGGSTVGFLAGPPTGVYTHHDHVTKPCRRRLTDGHLACPYCGVGKDPVWKGALPYYSREYAREWVWTSEEHRLSLLEIPLHAQIEISRDKKRCSPCVARPKLFRTYPLPEPFASQPAVSLIDLLVGVVWDDAELQTYHTSRAVEILKTAMSLPPTPTDQGERILREAGVRELDQVESKIRKRFKLPPKADVTGIGEMPGDPKRNGSH